MNVPKSLENMMKAYDATKKCMKKRCHTKAFKLAEQEINAMVQTKIKDLGEQLTAKKLNATLYLKQLKELMIEKKNAMKTNEHFIAFYACGLKECSKDFDTFRTASIKLLESDIAEAKAFIRKNKNDETKKAALQFRQESLENDKQRLALLKKTLTPPALIDFFQ